MRDECNKMEGNKDEAKKCLEIARRSKAEGDKEKAKKFLKKSLKLFPFKETESKHQNIISTHEHIYYFNMNS